MTATAQQTAVHLAYVIDNWPHLTDMLTTRHGSTWPPAGRMSDQIRAEDGYEAARALMEALWVRADERADSRYTLGESPAPIRLQIVDTMRAITADLVYLCDILSQEVQRPPMKHAPGHWAHADRVKRDLMADRDAADPRRWHRRHARTAPSAAGWLLGRVQRAPGPFLTIGPSQIRRVEAAAVKAHDRVERALDGVRHAEVVGRPCPLCGGALGMSSGDGEAPLVVCFTCQHEWKLPLAEVA